MIDYFRSLAVFVAVADAGSFSAAGRRLQLSTSVVSHHLSRLESKLGVTLFYRSTRSMSLTAEGQSALPSARRMVEAGEEALDLMGVAQDELVGALQITMPAWGEQLRLRQSLWQFAKLHPLVAISLHSSDRPADLVKDGFDLAIRLGTLSDSGKGFGRFSVRKPLMQEPAWALGLSYGDLCCGLVERRPCVGARRLRRQHETRPRPL